MSTEGDKSKHEHSWIPVDDIGLCPCGTVIDFATEQLGRIVWESPT